MLSGRNAVRGVNGVFKQNVLCPQKGCKILILVIRPLKVPVCRTVWSEEREKMGPSILRDVPMAPVKLSQTH